MHQVDNCEQIIEWNVDSLCASCNEAFEHAAQSTLVRIRYHAKRPWISLHTLQLLSERDQARIVDNPNLEKVLA